MLMETEKKKNNNNKNKQKIPKLLDFKQWTLLQSQTATSAALTVELCLQRNNIFAACDATLFQRFFSFSFFLFLSPDSEHCNATREGLMVLLSVWALIITQASVIYYCSYSFNFYFFYKTHTHTHTQTHMQTHTHTRSKITQVNKASFLRFRALTECPWM